MVTRSIFIVAIGIITLVGHKPALAQNCSLRNPDRQIYKMYPNATSYKTITKPITKEIRIEIETMLGSPLRLREIGKHSACVVLNGKAPIGFVHARTEIGQRGALELVWAYDLDLTLVDFEVQRCRERNGDLIKSNAFRSKLVGSDLSTLRSYLIKKNLDVNVQALDLPNKAKSIAHTTVLCGVTTRIVTELVFGDEIFNARLMGNVYRFFPETAKGTKVKTKLSNRSILVSQKSNTPAFAHDSLVVLRSISNEGETLGSLVYAKWSALPSEPELWLAVYPGGTIANAVIVGDVDDATRMQLSSLVGERLPSSDAVRQHRADSPIRCARELMNVLNAHGLGE